MENEEFEEMYSDLISHTKRNARKNLYGPLYTEDGIIPIEKPLSPEKQIKMTLLGLEKNFDVDTEERENLRRLRKILIEDQ